MATFGDLITRTMTRVRLQGGLDVQTYAQPLIAEMLQHKFDTLFDRRFWKHLRVYETLSLDGTTGQVTADVSDRIKRFMDVRYIWPENYRRPIPELPGNVNPAHVTMICFRPINDATKVFQVLPKTSSFDIEVCYRTKLDAFTETDEVPMDDQLLILGTCYDYAIDKGADGTKIQKFLNMYRDRLNSLESNEDNNTFSMQSPTATSVNEWHEIR